MEDLQSKSLQDIGLISGNGLLRLSFRKQTNSPISNKQKSEKKLKNRK